MRSRARRRRGDRRSARAGAEQAASAPCRSKAGTERPEPDPVLARLAAGDEHDRPVEPLDEPRGDDPDHARDASPRPRARSRDGGASARATPRPGGSRRAGCDPRPPGDRGSASRARRRAGAPRRSSSVSSSSSAAPGWPSRPAALIRGASRKPTAPVSTVAGSTPADAHERLQAGPVGPREPPHPGGDERAVLVERAGRRRRRSRARRGRGWRSSSSAPSASSELVDDAGAAELRERVVGRPRRDDRAVGQGLARPVVVGDDDLEPRRPGLRDLLDGRDPAVDGQNERATLLREPRQRLARDAVALLEAARQVPLDVGAEAARAPSPRARSRRCRPRRSRRARRSARLRRSSRGSRAQAASMSPSRNGSWPGGSAARKALAASGSPYPRRTRTLAVASPTPSAVASRRPPCGGTDGSSRCPRASQFTVGPGSDGPLPEAGSERTRLSSDRGDRLELHVGGRLRRRVPRLPLQLQRDRLRAARQRRRRAPAAGRAGRARRGGDGRPRRADGRRADRRARRAASASTSSATGSASRSSTTSRSSTGSASSSSAAPGSTTA